MPRPPVPVVLALVAAVLFGLFFIAVDLGGEAAGGSVLAITAERPSGPQTLGAALAVLGTLIVSAAQAAG
jgi:hypothetical protein